MVSKKLLENFKGEVGWNFALVNGRFAEVWFKVGKGIAGVFAHGYVKREKYKTKREQRMIDIDLKKNRFTYRKGKYSLSKKLV